MKLTKYTFRSPLFGSVACEDLLVDTDGGIDLCPSQMARMFDRHPELGKFLEDNKEDLTEALPEEMERVVLKAVIGDYSLFEGEINLFTHVWVEEPLTETGIEQIQEWITGQMSDGWGEGIEQRPYMTRTVRTTKPYFDEEELDVEEEDVSYEVCYYATPWDPDKFFVELYDSQEEEVKTATKVVAAINLPGVNRQVFEITGTVELRMFMMKHNATELSRYLDPNYPVDDAIYLVREVTPDADKILPKWVCKKRKFYDLYVLDNPVITQMTQDNAIVTLLK